MVVALKEHYAARRLPLEDLEARVEAVYRARSVPELDHPAADLGRLPTLPGSHQRRHRRVLLAASVGAVLLSASVYLGLGSSPSVGPPGGGVQQRPLDTSSVQTGTRAQAAGEAYLLAIENEQWDQAQARLCSAMRRRFPSGAAIAKAVYADNGRRPASHQILCLAAGRLGGAEMQARRSATATTEPRTCCGAGLGTACGRARRGRGQRRFAMVGVQTPAIGVSYGQREMTTPTGS